MRRLPALTTLTAAFVLTLGGVAFADAEVTINDDGLSPETVEADIREMIVWTNASDADVSLVGTDPKWESGPIEPGATFSIEITKAGTYAYGSEDGSISGEIVVAAAGGDATEDATEGTGGGNGGGDAEGEKANKDAKDKRDAAAEDEADEKVDPNEEALPVTGLDATVPGALSVALIGFGAGLVALTEPRRRRKA